MLRPIKSKEEHSIYLSRAYELMQLDLSPNSKESDELEVISILIEAYEKENFPIESPNPIEAILFRIEQLGMSSSELNKLLGSRSRTSEILNGKRKLSIGMIRKLHEKLGIPAQILIKDYELTAHYS
ncbi:MAG: helix-turn-helix domain-containing protein [Saprospiraceae bacterium]|nr:helix-turn-helix domain-containing protein [Saprospiraceae bacterium]MBP9197593.1 helix-turn-helix domain-containing protein [Saprospiraceae bacterium]